MKVDKLERLHPNDMQLFYQIARFIEEVCYEEDLELNAFIPKKRLCPFSATGLCYIKEKIIAITIRYRQDICNGGKWFNEPREWNDLKETALHEIAHLKHPNHSKDFKIYQKELVKNYFDFDKIIFI